MLTKGQEKQVFIPGWGFKSSIWKYADSIYLDFPLEREEGRDFAAVATCLAQMLPEKCVLIGWSFGGLLSIKLADLFPNKITKIILIASTPCFHSDCNWSGVDEHTIDLFMDKANQNIPVLIKYFLGSVHYPNKSIEIKQELKRSLVDICGQKSLWVNYLKMLFTSDLRSEFRRISVPILCVIGKQDAIVKIDQADIRTLNENAQIVVIQKAGHIPFLTHRQIFAAKIKKFLHHAD